MDMQKQNYMPKHMQKNFYERLGYEVVSEEFMDAGIPHVAMVKKF